MTKPTPDQLASLLDEATEDKHQRSRLNQRVKYLENENAELRRLNDMVTDLTAVIPDPPRVAGAAAVR